MGSAGFGPGKQPSISTRPDPFKLLKKSAQSPELSRISANGKHLISGVTSFYNLHIYELLPFLYNPAIIFCSSFSLNVLFSLGEHVVLLHAAFHTIIITLTKNDTALKYVLMAKKKKLCVVDMNLCVSTAIWIPLTTHFLLSSERVFKRNVCYFTPSARSQQ